MNKVYVDVVAEFSKEGCLIPILFVWEDGRKYKIDKVLKIERCASRKAGGVGTMYTCMVQGKEKVIQETGLRSWNGFVINGTVMISSISSTV